jgi:hypothetical protein
VAKINFYETQTSLRHGRRRAERLHRRGASHGRKSRRTDRTRRRRIFSDAKNSQTTGEQLFLNPARVYASYEEMAAREAALPADERIDFVSIVTPNFLHAPVATTFLKAGFHVVCDKPMTLTLKEAKALRETVRKTGKVFALTHNYTGYPMVKEARELVRTGKLGKILKVVAEYPQGWLLDKIEADGQKQASWRLDPKRRARAVLRRRHRHARGKSRPLHHRPGDRITCARSSRVHSRPQTGGRREYADCATKAARRAFCIARKFPAARKII